MKQSTHQSTISLSPENCHFKPKTFQKNLVSWYREHKSPWPWRTLWQTKKDPYHVWVSEIMLQQTVIKAVLPVYERFLKKYPSPFHLAKASTDEVKQTVQGLGYYRRFNLLHQAARQLCQDTKKIVWPTTFEEWKKLPGVGEYTASALMSIAYQEPYPVVDGNVERILARIFDRREALNHPDLKKSLKKISYHLLDSKFPSDYNQGLMELGQKICRPQSPRCPECPIRLQCQSFKNSSTHLSPGEKEVLPKEQVSMKLYILKRQEKYALYRRPEKTKFLKNIIGFYSEIPEDKNSKIMESNLLKKSTQLLKPSGVFNHSITKYKIKAEVYCVTLSQKSEIPKAIWFKKEEIPQHLTASLDLKAWKIVHRK